MGEMTSERACEVLNRERHNAARWRLVGFSGAAGERSDHTQYLSVVELIAIAEYLERRSAPPAGTVPVRPDRYELGRAAYEAAVACRHGVGDVRPRCHWDDLGLSDKEPYCQVAEAVAASLAAPPADAAEGDARLAEAISDLRSLVDKLAGSALVYATIDGEAVGVEMQAGSLRAILAAAEKAGPGPATRETVEPLLRLNPWIWNG